MKRNRGIKLLVAGLICASVSFVLVGQAAAGTFQCVIKLLKINPSTGDVILQVTPGTGEARFTGTGSYSIPATDEGASKLLAALLTAQSMGWEVRVSSASKPSTTVQFMNFVLIP